MTTDEMSEGFGSSFWSWVFFKKWKLLDSARSIVACYGFLALVFAFLTGLTAILYFPLQQYKIPYADNTGCIINTNGVTNPSKDHNQISKRCQVTFQITKQMKPPIHVHYYIQNAYINHRNYVNSYSKEQLQGNQIDLKTAQEKCKPFVFNKDLGKNISWSGKALDPDAIASPCGFKGMKLSLTSAYLYFNDTFKLKKLQSPSPQDIKIEDSQIGQIQGLGINFKSRNADEEWINPTDEHFVMWMQNQALMTKQRLWGRISRNLPPGKYSLLVQNNYKINTMRMTKGLKLSQSSKIGGKSYFIPIIFGLGTIGCAVYAILFYLKFGSLDQKLSDD